MCIYIQSNFVSCEVCATYMYSCVTAVLPYCPKQAPTMLNSCVLNPKVDPLSSSRWYVTTYTLLSTNSDEP